MFLSAFVVMAENRALIVGIGHYKVGTGWTNINGDADADLLSSNLATNGFSDIKILKNSQATKSAIVNELKSLALRCQWGDKVYFHFSGHGQPIVDLNGDEGTKGFDEAIVPYDAYKTITSRVGDGFYNGEAHLSDDELNPLFAAIKDKIGKNGQLFIAIDACYSDDMERAPGPYEANLPPTRGTSDQLNIKRTNDNKNLPMPKQFSKGAKMYVISACKSDERNFEYRTSDDKLYGSLTYFICMLMPRTMDFSEWAKALRLNRTLMSRFFPYQHPQVKVYD